MYKENGLALHKQQAQSTLKYCFRQEILFTYSNRKPQQYYPVNIKSEILKAKLAKNIPAGVTGVGLHKGSPLSECSAIDQSLVGYVLPLLPKAPMHIHKMQFKVRVSPDCYREIGLQQCAGNKGKEHVEIIGKVRVSYRFYPNRTVIVFTESSNNPFKLENEVDRSRLIAFFGQVRDRLVTFLNDIHERLVPDIMEWELTQCDINKDIQVGDGLQYAGIKVQVKHFDHLFRIYIKSVGKETICRVEDSLNPRKPAIEAINDILNPHFTGQDRRTLLETRNLVNQLMNKFNVPS